MTGTIISPNPANQAQPVNVSGNVVQISGQFVNTNVSVQISGVTATISVSGNPVLISGQVVQISGQTVYLTSGRNDVFIQDVSGNRLGPLRTNDVDNINLVGAAQTVFTFGFAYDDAFAGYNGIRMTTSGAPAGMSMSGLQMKLGVGFSGDTMVEYGASIKTGNLITVTSASGGVFLGSGSVFSVSVQNLGGSPVWVGGSGSFAPFSGKGFRLAQYDGVDLRVDDVGRIKVFGEASGDQVCWIGVSQ